MNHVERTAALVERVVANRDDELASLAYTADLHDNGHDDEALIARMLWPRLLDALDAGQSFDAMMAKVRRHLTIVRSAAALVAAREYNPPSAERNWVTAR
jgi:hypothetical protein